MQPITTTKTAVVSNRTSDRSVFLGLVSFLLWALGLAVEVGSFLLFVWAPGSTGLEAFPVGACLLHFVATALAVAGTWVSMGSNHQAARGWSVIVGFFAFFGGPLGYLAGVLCYLFGIGQPTELPLVDVVKAEMWIKQSSHTVHDIPNFEAELQQELTTQPIVDLLPYADVPTSIAIINKLFETRSRDDVKLLHKMTQDRRLEVYQYALSKLDELEKDYGTRIFHIKEQLRFRPNDPVLRVDLAKLYLDYTHSGLLDGLLEDYYWELTLAQIFEAIRFDERARAELIPEVGKLFIEKKMFKEAALMVEDSLKKDASQVGQQMLLLNSLYSQAMNENRPELLAEARRHALESGWAVKLPRRREGKLYDSVHFWFGRLRNIVKSDSSTGASKRG